MKKTAIKEAEIHITDECPHDCIFCSVKKHSESNPSVKEIKKNSICLAKTEIFC